MGPVVVLALSLVVAIPSRAGTTDASKLAALAAQIGSQKVAAGPLDATAQKAATTGSKHTAGSVKTAGGNRAAAEYAKGFVRGQPFEVKSVDFDGIHLVFKSAPKGAKISVGGSDATTRKDAFVGIGLELSTSQILSGEYYISSANKLVGETTEQPRPQLVRYTIKDAAPEMWQNDAPYFLRLKFFKEVKGMMPGYIDLAVSDGTEQTNLKGFFYVARKSYAP